MEKDMTIKIKYSRTDKIVLGWIYTSWVICAYNNCSASMVACWHLHGSGMITIRTELQHKRLGFTRCIQTSSGNDMIWRGFFNSFYSIAFAAISVFVTILAAYPMSKKEFVGRKFFNVIFIITMFFGGGMIPTFILINQLHMVNTVWAIPSFRALSMCGI